MSEWMRDVFIDAIAGALEALDEPERKPVIDGVLRRLYCNRFVTVAISQGGTLRELGAPLVLPIGWDPPTD